LRNTLRDAKRTYFESILTDTSTPVWDVAKWRHGRREATIHPIRSPSGELTTDFNSMARVFKDRFFDITASGPSDSAFQALPEVPNSSGTASTLRLRLVNGEQVLGHLPAQRVNLAHGCPHPDQAGALLQPVNSGGPSFAAPRRPFLRVTEDEVRQALAHTSNKSAPGPSGITYKLLKWTFEANPGLIITTLNGALEHGTHPWGTADVVVIPKPHKPDYSVAKAYRPISLLECTGKLLEKVVANRLGADERNFHLINPTQFGSQKYHSAPDAATLLRFKAEMTIRNGNVGGVLLLDISRFFDHLDPATTVATLADLGVDPNTCAWVHSFMTERTLRLTFNGERSDPFRQDVGVPQGSPLSPILSALYTSPILREALSWSDQDLALYVDDGCIYTSAPTFSAVAQQLAAAASLLLSWLRRLGLTVDADKTELMFFHRNQISNKRNGAQVDAIHVSDGNLSFTVKRATWIRYLGVFFTPTLDWTLHVRTLANRARSTVRALGVLGNSVRGFSLLSWRKIFVGIILPIFTYASQVWFTDVKQKTLLHHLQVAQNDACRKLAGVFRTTPVHLTEKLLNIPPVRYRFRHLLRNAGARLARLPSDCALRTLDHTRPVLCIPRHVPLLPLYPSCAETPPLFDIPFTHLPHPSTPLWHHDHFLLHPRPPKQKQKPYTIHSSKTVLSDNTAPIKILITTAPSPVTHLKIAMFAIFHHHKLITSAIHSAPSTQAAYLICLEAAFSRAPPSTHVRFFYNDSALPFFIFNHHLLPNLPYVNRLTNTLDRVLLSHFHNISGHWYSPSWSWPWKVDWTQTLVERATQEAIHHPSPTPSKTRMFDEWNQDYEARESDPPYLPFTQPSHPDHLHPFVQGVIDADSRRLQCAAFQVITGHSFQGDYSLRHCPTAPDNTTCPHCGRFFNTHHIFFGCPHFAIPRTRLLVGGYLSLHTIFSNTHGGRRLCEFLKITNTLLRPLPPPPDQPRDPTYLTPPLYPVHLFGNTFVN
jgi:hypothetical protein